MSAADLVARLGLAPHPEGGFYREVHRAERQQDTPRGPRSDLTMIHFLLPAGTFSAWHAVSSEEVWCHVGGDPLHLHLLGPDGARRVVLTGDPELLADGPTWVVRPDELQAAEPASGPHGYALCACLVAPGFDFADFSMPARTELLAAFPNQAAWVRRFTRSEDA